MNIREHVTALNARRINIFEQQKAFVDDCIARHPQQPFNAEERRRMTRMDEEMLAIQKEVDKYVATEERANDDASLRMAHGEIFGTGAYERSQSEESETLRTFLRGDAGVRMEVPIAGAQRERAMLRAGASPSEVRALLWDTGSVASAVPTTMARTLYEYFEAETAMFRAPTTKMITDHGEPVLVPSLGAHSIGTQVIAQGTAIGGTDPTFTRVQFNAYKYGSLVQVASESLEDTGIDLLTFLFSDMGRALGRITDTALVTGSGSGAPKGLMTALAASGAGSVTTGGSLITPTYESLVDLKYSVVDAYRNMGHAAWIMKDSTAGTLSKLRDGAGGTIGAALWRPSITQGIQDGQPDLLLGSPVFTDPNIASAGSNARLMSYGDMSAYYIRQVHSIVLERSDDFAFNTDLVTLRAKIRLDGNLMDQNAIHSLLQNV